MRMSRRFRTVLVLIMLVVGVGVFASTPDSASASHSGPGCDWGQEEYLGGTMSEGFGATTWYMLVGPDRFAGTYCGYYLCSWYAYSGNVLALEKITGSIVTLPSPSSVSSRFCTGGSALSGGGSPQEFSEGEGPRVVITGFQRSPDDKMHSVSEALPLEQN